MIDGCITPPFSCSGQVPGATYKQKKKGNLSPASRGRALGLAGRRRTARGGGGDGSRTNVGHGRGGADRDLLLPLSPGLGRGGVPVVHHLRGQYAVQREPGDEPVQDQLVVHLLQRREDPGQGAGEVVEHL